MPLLLLALALTTGSVPTGTLRVTGPDYGAEVAVDRRPVGRIPSAPLTVSAGLHLVEILRDGRTEWTRVVFVGVGETVELAVTLAPRPGPAPTLGDLRRAPTEPPGPPTRYGLSGAVLAEGARVGDAWDLDLNQRWRLDAAAGEVLSAALEVRAVGDLAGSGAELWRTVHRSSDDPLLVEALWLRARGAGLDGRLGRMVQAGPAGQAFLLDGARLGGRLGPAALYARGGRRRALIGRDPDDPWLAGAGLTLGGGDWGLALHGLHHQRLHVDASGFASGGPGRVTLSGATVGQALSRGEVRLESAAILPGLRRIWISGRWRGAVDGPFGLSDVPLGIADLQAPAGWTGRAGLGIAVGPVRGTAGGGIFRGDGSPSPGRADRMWIDAASHLERGRWDVSARLGGLVASPGPRPTVPALADRLHAGVGGALRRGRWRLTADAGVERLTVARPGGHIRRWLPVGGVGATVALTESLSLVGGAEVAAAHPSLHPSGGPLMRGRLGMTLR